MMRLNKNAEEREFPGQSAKHFRFWVLRKGIPPAAISASPTSRLTPSACATANTVRLRPALHSDPSLQGASRVGLGARNHARRIPAAGASRRRDGAHLHRTGLRLERPLSCHRQHGSEAWARSFTPDGEASSTARTFATYRKKRLAMLLGRRRVGIVLSEHTDEDGAPIFRQACRMGLEGVESVEPRVFVARHGRATTVIVAVSTSLRAGAGLVVAVDAASRVTGSRSASGRRAVGASRIDLC